MQSMSGVQGLFRGALRKKEDVFDEGNAKSRSCEKTVKNLTYLGLQSCLLLLLYTLFSLEYFQGTFSALVTLVSALLEHAFLCLLIPLWAGALISLMNR